MARAVVLLSGGLDSTVVAALAREEGLDVFGLSLHYGQRHERELQAAADVAAALGLREHRILRLPLGELGGSSLTDRGLAVPDAPDAASIGATIPSTYVPARNTVFLSFALAYAEVIGADSIHIGANAVDYSGYPDCRPAYLEAFERMANLATKRGVEGASLRIVAPLLHLSKAEIVATGLRVGAPLAATWSCYRGGAAACGTCESCVLRREGFRQAGHEDPIAYEVA